MSRSAYNKGKEIAKPDNYASFGFRLGAWFFDILIVSLITHLFYWLVIISILKAPLNFILWNVFSFIFGFFYFWISETYNNGQTLFKLIFGIRTVNEETFEKATMKNLLINCLLKCHWLPGFFDFAIGVLYNYGEPEKKLRIMENVSQTVVIKTR